MITVTTTFTAARVRYYKYFTKFYNRLALVTIACKRHRKKFYCKQVAIHFVHSKYCFVKDIALCYGGNYSVGWFEQGIQKHPRWFESTDWDYCLSKYYNLHTDIVNIDYVLSLPQYKYSAVDLYKYHDVLKYLRMYEEYQHAELLVKFGMAGYATSIQILQKTAADKAFCKWLIAHREQLQYKLYYVPTILQAYKTGKDLQFIQNLLSFKKTFHRSNVYDFLKPLFPSSAELEKFAIYLGKQQIDYNIYYDYFVACRELAIDMTLPKNKYPHNFMYWHDIRISQYQTKLALLNEQKKQKLYAQFANVANKYLPLQKDTTDFVVLLAKTPNELVEEGKALQHCVGSLHYDQKFVREESLIFFARNSLAPSVPFVTVEYSLKEKRILQCYSLKNSKPNETVLNFINKQWLPFANRKLNKILKAA